MKKLWLFSAVLIVFVTGGIVGFYVAHHNARIECGKFVADMMISDTFLDTSDTFETLRDLRRGNTNDVFDTLELKLDGDIVGLSAFLKENPTMEHAKNYRILLRKIGDYRTTFLHKTDNSEFDQGVAAALAEVTKEPPR
jgi:hypothetical protein